MKMMMLSKKGQKVAVDKLVSVEEEDIDTQFYYKIAGKDEYIYGGEAIMSIMSHPDKILKSLILSLQQRRN